MENTVQFPISATFRVMDGDIDCIQTEKREIPEKVLVHFLQRVYALHKGAEDNSNTEGR